MSEKGDASRERSITACVINYQGEEYLHATLMALRQAKVSLAEVLVVDDASTDGSVALLERDHPDVELVRLSENCGPAEARNVGFRRATSDLVLFIDNDVAVAPDTPALLARSLRLHPRAVLAMPRVIYAHDPNTIQYDGAASHFIGLMKLENEDRPLSAAAVRTREIQSLVTACFMIDRSRWGGVGPFDDSFGYLLEDHDLGLRARMLGHVILSVPADCFHGLGTRGLSLRRTGTYAERRVIGLIRNRWRLLLKNYEARTLIVLSPILLAFECFQLVGAIKKGWVGQWLVAIRSILQDRKRIRVDRSAVQAARRSRDRQILTGGPIPFSGVLFQGRLEKMAGHILDGAARAYWRFARGLI